jgi:DNA-binding FadR family transcriptional regulator
VTKRESTTNGDQEVTVSGHQSLSSEIVAWMTEQLRSGAWVAGDRLPSERELGEQFSVSRVVVREALSQLKSEGLIVTQQGRRAFVAERTRRQSFRIPEVSIDEKEAQAHVLELLVAIEGAAARLAAARRTAEDLKAIRRALIGMQYAVADDRLGDKEDYAFHQAISDATHNPHFSELGEYLEHGVRRLIRQARSNTAARHAHMVQAVQDEHQAIFDAIAAGDSAVAGLAAETHLRNAARRLATYTKTTAHKLEPKSRSQAGRVQKRKTAAS